MHIAAVVLSLVLAVAMLGSGVVKLARAPQMIENMRAVHVSIPQMVVLGVLEVAATVGLVIGLWWGPLGLAAAIGAVLYFGGAVVAHIRASDRNIVPAAVLLALAVATLVVLSLA
jgi:hypothetical protein